MKFSFIFVVIFFVDDVIGSMVFLGGVVVIGFVSVESIVLCCFIFLSMLRCCFEVMFFVFVMYMSIFCFLLYVFVLCDMFFLV